MNVSAAAALAFGLAMVLPALPSALSHELGSDVSRYHAARGAHGGMEAAVALAAPAWTPFQGTFTNPFATPPRPLEWPKIAPYPPGQGDTDGLSRNIDDCNKGCIDGPY